MNASAPGRYRRWMTVRPLKWTAWSLAIGLVINFVIAISWERPIERNDSYPYGYAPTDSQRLRWSEGAPPDFPRPPISAYSLRNVGTDTLLIMWVPPEDAPTQFIQFMLEETRAGWPFRTFRRTVWIDNSKSPRRFYCSCDTPSPCIAFRLIPLGTLANTLLFALIARQLVVRPIALARRKSRVELGGRAMCGYDRRGNKYEKCPECGHETETGDP